MSWQKDFHEAMTKAIIENGSVVAEGDDNSNYYGWTDYESSAHLHGYDWHTGKPSTPCPITTHGIPFEESWDEFGGTFDDSLHEYGMSINVTCACGMIVDRKVRWATSFGNAIRRILLEAD